MAAAKGAAPCEERQLGPLLWRPRSRQLEYMGSLVHLDARAAGVFAVLAKNSPKPVQAQRLRKLADELRPLASEAVWECVSAINDLLAAYKVSGCFVSHHPREGFLLVLPPQKADDCVRVENAGNGSVIGRDDAMLHIASALREHRFLTILGQGGLGKTTVASCLANDSTDDYPDGVFMVDLSRLADRSLVAQAVGTALCLPLVGSDPLVGLAAFVRQKRMLVVLDSCEHVIENAARVAEVLLSAGPDIHVLATSREPLLAVGEWLHRLPALETPRKGERLTRSSVSRFSAVELFLHCVIERHSSFEPTSEDFERVADICRRLDGLPLAIEIAAARATEIGLAKLSRQLDERLLFAEAQLLNAPDRHQTLAAMLDWSHDQLGEAERAALRQLSVFRGRFTLEAAAAVVATVDIAGQDVGSAVLDLAEKSLLSRTASGTFRLLDTTRVYASTKLLPTEASGVFQRHALYLLSVLRHAEADWQTMAVRPWLDRYGEWIDDIRQSLDWCFGEQGNEWLGADLAFASFALTRQMSLDMEFRRYTQRALSVLEQRVPRDFLTEITLKAYLGSMGQRIDLERSPQHISLEQILELEGARIAAKDQIIAIGSINHAALMSAEFATATRWAERAIMAARDSGDAVAFMIARRMHAQTLHFLGQHDEAGRLAQAVLNEAWRKIPLAYVPSPVDSRVSMRLLFARMLWMKGKARSAAQMADECMQLAESDTAISRCQALAMCALPLALWNREFDVAGALAARLRQVAERHSLAYWVYWAERVELVVELQAGGMRSPDPRLFIAGSAEANLRDHLCTFDARLLGSDVIARVESGQVGWCAPEVLRLRAEAAMRDTNSASSEVERLFRESIALASRQQALAWELRASMSLADWLVSEERVVEGRSQLALTLEKFDVGECSVDLAEARRKLVQL